MKRSASSLLLIVACARSPDAVDPTDTPAAIERFSVSGKILGLRGQPIQDVFVTVSTEYCIPDRTGSDGSFSVGEVDQGPKRLITYGETASNGLFASVSVAFEAEGDLAFDTPIHTPELTEIYPLDPRASTPQVIESSQGLLLTIAKSSLSLAPFAPEELQLARVPWLDAPVVMPAGVELIDLFVLHPIQSTLNPPAAVTFPATTLDVDTAVVFYSLNYDTGQMDIVARGAIDSLGRPATHPGEGLPELTWVGVALE